jgi:hypothetical protein
MHYNFDFNIDLNFDLINDFNFDIGLNIGFEIDFNFYFPVGCLIHVKVLHRRSSIPHYFPFNFNINL